MRLRFDLELGPLRVIFDPWPDPEYDEPDQDDDEPALQGMGSVDSLVIHRDDHNAPELHMGFRGGYFEE